MGNWFVWRASASCCHRRRSSIDAGPNPPDRAPSLLNSQPLWFHGGLNFMVALRGVVCWIGFYQKSFSGRQWFGIPDIFPRLRRQLKRLPLCVEVCHCVVIWTNTRWIVFNFAGIFSSQVILFYHPYSTRLIELNNRKISRTIQLNNKKCIPRFDN